MQKLLSKLAPLIRVTGVHSDVCAIKVDELSDTNVHCTIFIFDISIYSFLLYFTLL